MNDEEHFGVGRTRPESAVLAYSR